MKSLKVVNLLKLERAIIIHPAEQSYRPIPFRRSPENVDTGFESRYSVLFIDCQVMIKCLFRLGGIFSCPSSLGTRFCWLYRSMISFRADRCGLILVFRLSVLNIEMFATKAATTHSTEVQVVQSTWHIPSLKLTGKQMTILTTRKIPREKDWKVANLPGRSVESRVMREFGYSEENIGEIVVGANDDKLVESSEHVPSDASELFKILI
jgi:hypothetical protein